MPRIRSLKPTFWDSPSTASADLAPRLLYMAMWNWADDSGRGTANLKELEAFAFPNDDVSELPRRARRGASASGSGNSAPVWRNFAEVLYETVKAYDITLYSVNGRKFFEISSFRVHQSKNFRPDSQLPGPNDGEIWDLSREYGFEQPPEAGRVAEVPRPDAEIPRLAAEHCPLDRDRDRDRDVVYDDTREPPDGPCPPEVVYDTAPEHIDNPSKPSRNHPGSAALTVVRHELGNVGKPYPRATHERLATQVERLARDGHADTVIRAALREWDRREDCAKPEFLPTVLSDTVKAARAAPAPERLTPGEAKVAGWASLGQTTNTGDGRKAITA